MIRLYGVDKGQSSWPRVTHGIRGALGTLKALASFYDVARVDHDDDDALDVAYDAHVGLCVGPPLAASVMIGRGDHKERLLMIATNSSWLPYSIMDRAQKIVTGFVGTSEWASSVIKKYAGDVPVYTWPHGVDPDFKPPGTYAPGLLPGKEKTRFSVLHLASTHMQRKGTQELIEGWAQAKREGSLGGDALLRLVVDGPRGLFLSTISDVCKGDMALADSYQLARRMDLTCAAMRDFYCQHHAVCQPSRGEGFGLVPLEARASGVPVIATACTGHADHLSGASAGVVLVPHGDEARIDDGPDAMAPTVAPSDIAAALCEASDRWVDLAESAADAAEEVRRNWSWVSTTSNFLVKHEKLLSSGA